MINSISIVNGTMADLVDRVRRLIDFANNLNDTGGGPTVVANTTVEGIVSITDQSFAGNKTFIANVAVSGTLTSNSASVTNNVAANNVTVTNVVTANSVLANNATVTNNVAANNVTVTNVMTANSVLANNATITNNVAANNVTVTNVVTANTVLANTVTVTTTVTANTVLANNATVTNNVAANNATVTNVASANSVLANNATVTNNVAANNATITSAITANTIAASNVAVTNINITGALDINGAPISTTTVPEGVNLYYTDSRARAAISNGAGITYNVSTGVIAASGGSSTAVTKMDSISGSFNGSTTAFNLTASSVAYSPGSAKELIVSFNGVIQNPDVDYTVSGSIITFTTAPASGSSCFIVAIGALASDTFDAASVISGTLSDSRLSSNVVFKAADNTFTGNNTFSGSNSFTTNPLNLAVGQLKFPGTQNASSDSNTLDDYEEGTFTPAVNFGGSTAGFSYSIRVGYYIKIGKMVFVCGRYVLTAKGSVTGAATITGLPFTVHSGANGYAALNVGEYENYSGVTGIGGYFVIGAAQINMKGKGTTGTDATLLDSHFTNTSDLMFSGCYIASA